MFGLVRKKSLEDEYQLLSEALELLNSQHDHLDQLHNDLWERQREIELVVGKLAKARIELARKLGRAPKPREVRFYRASDGRWHATFR
jgi:hypothetical protein